MTSIINAATFIPADEQPEDMSWVVGVVDVTLRGETRTVRAWQEKDGMIVAFGMTGRYQTGTKAWAATVSQRTDPRTGKVWDDVSFGRDDRSTKFQKTNSLSFA